MKLPLLFICLFFSIGASYAQTNDTPPEFYDQIEDVVKTSRRSTSDAGSKPKLKVYPNPAPNGNFSVALEAFTGDKIAVSITDANGKLINNRRVEDGKENGRINYNLSGVERGMYVLKVTNGKTSSSTVFFVKG